MAREWLVRRGEKVAGPISDEKLAALVHSGKLIGTDGVSCDGGATFAPVSSIVALRGRAAINAPHRLTDPTPLESPNALPSIQIETTNTYGWPKVHEYPYASSNGSLLLASLGCLLCGGWALYAAATGAVVELKGSGVVGGRILALACGVPVFFGGVASLCLLLSSKRKPLYVVLDVQRLTIPRWRGRPLVVELKDILYPEIKQAGYGMLQCHIKPKKGMLAICALHSSWFGGPHQFMQFAEALKYYIQHCGQQSGPPA